MSKIVLYTTDCPKCKVLESKLNGKRIEYDVCRDVSVMESMGVKTVPMLEVDGKMMNCYEAVLYVNAQD